MIELSRAVNTRNWPAACRARSAAWDEVNQLPAELTGAERPQLWEYKHLITAGIDWDRREAERRVPDEQANEGPTQPS
ncbi:MULTISPECIES: hypothetical protein [Streptacidiphilus]|uniref:Transposase n=1 Tax=Streptacidiphilus cavernicola TaxID=3342716 RepID=A0ABV6UWP8_9ACTN|nr:hypothetical protein [Streptacidiphilus jeojiense]